MTDPKDVNREMSGGDIIAPTDNAVSGPQGVELPDKVVVLVTSHDEGSECHITEEEPPAQAAQVVPGTLPIKWKALK